MQNFTDEQVLNLSNKLSNTLYHNNVEATRQLIILFNKIVRNTLLVTIDDYADVYDAEFFTFQTWDDLLKSETEMSDGWDGAECQAQMNTSIWMLPCGWYVQRV